jgi:hypothetical protein
VVSAFGASLLQPADDRGIDNGAAAAHRVGKIEVSGDPVPDGAARDADEIAQHLVGGAEQAIVMGEFDVL